MMKTHIITSIPDSFDWNELSSLFARVGWGERSPQRLESAFRASKNICFVYENHKLVGCARSINDGEWYSIIVDVLVDPEFQNCGIGTQLMQSLISQTSELPWVILASEVGKEQFYEKLGFQKMKYGYILPKSESMADRYCE